MKAKLHPTIEEYRGALGEIVFREVNGKTIVSRKASPSGEPTANQLAHRERFKDAAAYGKTVIANEVLSALYEEAAKAKKITIYLAAITDYIKAPSIQSVDLSTYNGHVGSLIQVHANDDFGLTKVHVSITNSQGMPLENGDAVESTDTPNLWVYTAKFNVPADTLVMIRVVATDLPGGTAVQEESKQL